MILEPGMPVVCVDAEGVNELVLGGHYTVEKVGSYPGALQPPFSKYRDDIVVDLVEIQYRAGPNYTLSRAEIERRWGPSSAGFSHRRFHPRYGRTVDVLLTVASRIREDA